MANKVWEFNRGEWTEAYVFLKLLGNGRIYGATAQFEKDPDVYIDILNVIRYEKESILKFQRENDQIFASKDDEIFKVVCCDELSEKAEFLYNAIMSVKNGKGKTSIPEIEEYLKGLEFSQPKVPSLPAEAQKRYGAKTDIIITGRNSLDGSNAAEGFSIKSHLGNASTLFNSSSTSGFLYRVKGCTFDEMHKINLMGETEIFRYIRDNPDLDLEYIGCRNDNFKENLSYVDLQMDDILQMAVLIQLGYLPAADSSNIRDIVKRLAEINPIPAIRNGEHWYVAKFKELLFSTFAGMTATKPWDGRRRITGGYIDVSNTGEILYYRAMSDDIFMSYLYEHTYIDRPSRGVEKDVSRKYAQCWLKESRSPSESELMEVRFPSKKKKDKKGDWGYIYQKDDDYFIAVNFQIRFR